MNRFAIFILSHGRADTISTYDALRKSGYTGDMYVVIDNEDDQEGLYREKFGSEIIQFDKRDYVAITDVADLDEGRKIGVFARNFIQDKAKEMGYQFHLQLDDDIHGFGYRYIDDKGKLRTRPIHGMDRVLEAMCDYMASAPITSLSFGLQIYYVGGVESGSWQQQMIPKTMTTFLMRADDVRYFNMRMNDDITTSALNVSRGSLYYTYMPVMVEIDGTQEQKGGMTEIYQDSGTYRKSFYSVMALPSCAKVSQMGITDMRVHHEIHWGNCAPKLLDERFRRV
ncbi:MAG: hypothetical protein K5637_01900 [Lachnospiraceae bacterium]|nr:hypothetical protein [Lachnospiraceae bacterium]